MYKISPLLFSPTEHEIPETLTLQVVCSGQIVAQTEFTYYANAQYNSDLLFQYLVQNFPSYFPEAGMDGGMGGQGGGSAGGGGGGGGGYYNYGNIPPTSFNLLLGSCRLGIEELVKATLQLPAMTAITTEQVRITGVSYKYTIDSAPVILGLYIFVYSSISL